MERQAEVESLHLMSIDSKYKINSFFHLENLTFFGSIYSFEIHFPCCVHFFFLSIHTAETLLIALGGMHIAEKKAGEADS